jgi:hypothetical protein
MSSTSNKDNEDQAMKQDMELSKLAGVCGLYCGTCPYYLAYRENDINVLKELSKSKGVPIENVRCDGCLFKHRFYSDCTHRFLRCASEKKVIWCFQCNDFPCQRLKDFLDIHIVNGISHHAHVIEALQYMKKHGIEDWVKNQEKLAPCPKCGKRLYWFVRNCSECGVQVR